MCTTISGTETSKKFKTEPQKREKSVRFVQCLSTGSKVRAASHWLDQIDAWDDFLPEGEKPQMRTIAAETRTNFLEINHSRQREKKTEMYFLAKSRSFIRLQIWISDQLSIKAVDSFWQVENLKNLMDTYHWKYRTWNSTLMYLLAACSC